MKAKEKTMNEEQTLPTLQTLIDVVNALRQEVAAARQETNERIEKLEVEMKARFEQLENSVNARFEQMRLEMMSFDVRLDRVEGNTHEIMNITLHTRADVKVLREEVYSWSKDVTELQKPRREADTLVR